jgi:hypothetical protein
LADDFLAPPDFRAPAFFVAFFAPPDFREAGRALLDFPLPDLLAADDLEEPWDAAFFPPPPADADLDPELVPELELPLLAPVDAVRPDGAELVP